MAGASNGQEISILGIIPRYPKHSQNNIYAKIKMPPVGIISVLTQISHDTRFREVYAIDENNYRGPRDFTGNADHKFLQGRMPAKIVMFYGGMSNSVPRLFSLAQQYKTFGAITIAGGSHVDALPAEVLRSGIDIVVHGEGEDTAKEILNAIVQDGKICLDRNKLSNVKGISFLDTEGKHVFTGRREPIRELDRLDDPDLTLIKYLKKRWSSIPINRGRGCNWNCEFCVVNKQYGRYKACSIEKVLRQVIKYSDMGYKSFFFTDDNFAQNPDEAIALCKMIGDYKRTFKRNVDIIVQVRSEIAENDGLIEAMRFAGVKTLAIGYESPINEELKRMKKGVTAEKLMERSRKLSEHFYLHGMFIFSYPTFKDSEFRSGLTLRQRAKAYENFFKKARIDTVQVFNAVPLPGSELRAKLEAEGRILPLEMVGWDKYDGLFLCYDPGPEGLDAYDLQNFPTVLMKKWYQGNFLNRGLNYGNWVDWANNATIGFPIQFSLFYIRRFVHNLVERRREKSMDSKMHLLPKRNIFHESLVNTWEDIRRRWRNLFIKTYGAEIVRRWSEEYRKSDYKKKLKSFFSKRKKAIC
ncbi:MAG: radical SAM protein [Candidatus Woesearchaeota archaeon]